MKPVLVFAALALLVVIGQIAESNRGAAAFPRDGKISSKVMTSKCAEVALGAVILTTP